MPNSFSAVPDLEEGEAALIERHLNTIEMRRPSNLMRERYYLGEDAIRDLGISIPPNMRDLKTVVGWPSTAVDAVEERLDVDGWVIPGGSTADTGVDEIVQQNRLNVTSGPARLDALIYGLTFFAVSHGDTEAGEPDVLITAEPPTRMTGTWDNRLGRLSDALSVAYRDDVASDVSLFLPDQTIILHNDRSTGWEVVDVDDHKLGRPTVVVMANRPRSRRMFGTSRISRAVRSLTDSAVRTLLGMEVAREFYSSPQRYALGASEKDFVDANGNPKSAWEVYLGRFLALDKDENGNLPKIGQLAASSPAPYIDSLKGLASLLAAEACLPASYLGFHTDNPPSGDGMRMLEARLVKVAERCQTVFGASETETLQLAVEMAGGSRESVAKLTPIWRDASTPTRAASADAGTKLVGAGILQPDSEVTYEYVGLSETQREILRADARRQRVAQTVQAFAPDDPAPAAV